MTAAHIDLNSWPAVVAAWAIGSVVMCTVCLLLARWMAR